MLRANAFLSFVSSTCAYASLYLVRDDLGLIVCDAPDTHPRLQREEGGQIELRQGSLLDSSQLSIYLTQR